MSDVPAWVAQSIDKDALRRVLRRAKYANNTEVQRAVLNRLSDLEGLEHPDSPIRDIWLGVAALEEIRSSINGKTTRSEYTRRKLRNKGEIQSLEEWAHDRKETSGFKLLTEHGFVHLTAEYIVVKYRHRFTQEAVSAAEKKLIEHHVDLPISVTP